MLSIFNKLLRLAIVPTVGALAITANLNAESGYLIFNHYSGTYSVSEGADFHIATSIGIGNPGSIPSVPSSYTYQTNYYLSGSAIYGTDYIVWSKPSAYSPGDWQNITPNPNGEQRAFSHTTGRAAPSTDNTIIIRCLNDNIVNGLRTLVLSRNAANSFEQNLNVQIRIKDNDIIPSPSSTLSNLSSRGYIGSGNSAFIAGFIVSGGGTKSVVARGLGPTLTQYGVSGVCPNPKLELYGPAGLITLNDNWADAANSSDILSSGLAPSNSLESAILSTFTSNSYSVVCQPSNGAGGIGLLELFDTSGGSGTRLTNLSVRASVGYGDNVLIVGFIISGGPKKVLITAKGPYLSQFGISPYLSNPRLTLYNGSGQELESNDDWQGAWNASDIQSDALHPTYPQESAVLEVLPAGSYTAVVNGSSDGVGLVEVWER